ncbi:MAG TPA: glycoside hydrolase family 2 protein [Spirochaetia bacterium]|nr:glycoside hydrolase family 2 protein [Spirochaetia bacterium]
MKTIELNGTWTIRTAAGAAKANASLPGQVVNRAIPVSIPGDNLSALVAAGIASDPYYGRNELELQWIGRVDWLFEREFTVDDAVRNSPQVFLVFDSIDTVAEVSLNGTVVGSTDNMFVRQRYEVGSALKTGVNTVSVAIRSPEAVAAERAAALTYPIPHTDAPVQSPHRNLVRKVQCHGGWDWGPCLMVSGLYGSVRLEYASEVVEYVTTSLTRNGDDWSVRVSIDFTAAAAGNVAVSAQLAGASAEGVVQAVAGRNRHELVLTARRPELWWPVGYGGQKLYELSVKVGGESVSKQIGFRTVEVKAIDDELGRSMTVCVNGRDVFCKGGNWIPMDAMPARHTAARYEQLLEDCVQANMNMIRLWGGGQYENDIFYDTCDRKGILIWHDMMFSCSLYPSSNEFLDSARREIAHQVMRLKDHPSIALWCGNNEDVGAITWFDVSRKDPGRYIVDYDRLTEGVIGDTVRKLDPERPWWPSSPSAGPDDFTDCWHTSGRGDMHYWSVWHEGKPFSSYYDITPRFCSEFGYQSFASIETVASYAPKEQWNLTSPVLEHHQKNNRGNSIIIENFSRYYRLPDGFSNMLYLSQVQQALAMKTAVDYWRSLRPVCMGTLYWQINDNWPVASWSSIEYSGKWKLLHYVAKRFYEPVSIVAWQKGSEIAVYGLNDTADPVKATAAYRFIRFNGEEQSRTDAQVTLAPNSATRLWSTTVEALPFAPADGVLAVELRPSAGGAPIAVNDLFLTEPKRCELADPGIQMTVADHNGAIDITLTSKAPAFYVSLDIDSTLGRLTDNCLSVYPDSPVTIGFVPAPDGDAAKPGDKVTADAVKNALSLYHLRGTYA